MASTAARRVCSHSQLFRLYRTRMRLCGTDPGQLYFSSSCSLRRDRGRRSAYPPSLRALVAPNIMPKYVVRTGVMRALGVYSSSRDETYQRDMTVVVRTERGMEIGDVLCEATEAAISQIKDPG